MSGNTGCRKTAGYNFVMALMLICMLLFSGCGMSENKTVTTTGKADQGVSNSSADVKSQESQPQDGQAQDDQTQDGQIADGQLQDDQPQGGGSQDGQIADGQQQDDQPQGGGSQDGQITDEQSQDGQATDGRSQGEQMQGGQTQNVQSQGSGDITLAFTGDIYFPDNLYEYYQQDGLNGFLSQTIIDTMRGVDLYIADHEFVASDGGQMVDYQLYTFRAPLEREKLWQEMGTDIITLANNHTLDYGVSALQDTMNKLKEQGIPYVGAGNNLAEAITPCIKEVKGKRIAVFGSTRFVPQGSWYATESNPGLLTSYESTPYYGYILDAISEAKKTCDYVIIYVHFGVEKSHSVAEFQKNIAHGYIDAGADLVVGTHPHVLEGIEFYQGKPIAYSLGNFLFGNYHSDTVVFKATIHEDNSTDIGILPCSSQSYRTTDITGTEARKLFDFMESISFDIQIDDAGNIRPKTE